MRTYRVELARGEFKNIKAGGVYVQSGALTLTTWDDLGNETSELLFAPGAWLSVRRLDEDGR